MQSDGEGRPIHGREHIAKARISTYKSLSVMRKLYLQIYKHPSKLSVLEGAGYSEAAASDVDLRALR